jgi:hypothetical protein
MVESLHLFVRVEHIGEKNKSRKWIKLIGRWDKVKTRTMVINNLIERVRDCLNAGNCCAPMIDRRAI